MLSLTGALDSGVTHPAVDSKTLTRPSIYQVINSLIAIFSFL